LCVKINKSAGAGTVWSSGLGVWSSVIGYFSEHRSPDSELPWLRHDGVLKSKTSKPKTQPMLVMPHLMQHPESQRFFSYPCIYKKALIVDTEEEVSQIADRLPFGS
jgi:hypothetical protein